MSGDLPYEEKVIGEHLYRAYALPLEDWLELVELLAGILGEPLSALLRGEATFPGGEVSLPDFAVMASGAIKKLTKANLVRVLVIAGKSLQVEENGQRRPLVYDKQKLWWARQMAELAPAVALFLEAQFANFFAGIVTLLPAPSNSDAGLSESTSGSSPFPTS